MSMSFENGPTLISAPAMNGFTVTPNDSADLVKACRGIYLGAAGNVKLTTYNGDILTFVGLVAGIVHPITAVRIWASGTTATSIIALA
jgi:hypothetical protein